MTSNDPEIQKIYDQIKYYKSPQWGKCVCDKKCKHCLESYKELDDKFNNIPPTYKELEDLITKLIGINYNFKSRSMKWDTPFNKSHDKLLWADTLYHIVFIDYGIRIEMNRDILSKIAILDRILLQEDTGSDKPLRLNYLSINHSKVFEGPYLYITKLPLHSLIFNKPPADYNINIERAAEAGDMKETGYFKHNNLAECLIHDIWYS